MTLPDDPVTPASPEPEVTFCMYCGRQIAPDAAFCMMCGTPVGRTAPPSAAAGLSPAPGPVPAPAPTPFPVPAAAPGADPVRRRKRRTKLIDWLTVVALLLLGGGGAGWWFLVRTYVGPLTVGLGLSSSNQVQTVRDDLHASDIITGSVQIIHPNPWAKVKARWLKDGTELAAESFSFSKYEPSRTVALTLKKSEPLAPGEYVLDVTVGKGKPVQKRFQVREDVPVKVETVTVTNEGQTKSGAFSSASTAIKATGTIGNVNRFSGLTVTWSMGNTRLKNDQLAPKESDLAAGSVPFEYTLSNAGKPFKPGSYVIRVLDGEQIVHEQTFSVYADPRISNIQIGPSASNGVVTAPTTSLTNAYSVWTSFRVDSAPAGTKYEVEWWWNGSRQWLSGGEQIWTTTADQVGVNESKGIRNGSGLSKGTWQVVIRANGVEVGRKSFAVN